MKELRCTQNDVKMKNSNDLKENILNKENLMSLDISREKVEKTIIKGIEYK